MNFIKVNNYDELSTKSAALICAQVVMKPNCALLTEATTRAIATS